MILQYLKKKENKEQILATKQYKQIICESKIFLNENNFFITKDYKTSFEVISIFLIMFIRINLSDDKTSNEIVKRGLLEKIFGGVGAQQELPTTP